jgi:hypothetical protein
MTAWTRFGFSQQGQYQIDVFVVGPLEATECLSKPLWVDFWTFGDRGLLKHHFHASVVNSTLRRMGSR